MMKEKLKRNCLVWIYDEYKCSCWKAEGGRKDEWFIENDIEVKGVNDSVAVESG